MTAECNRCFDAAAWKGLLTTEAEKAPETSVHFKGLVLSTSKTKKLHHFRK